MHRRRCTMAAIGCAVALSGMACGSPSPAAAPPASQAPAAPAAPPPPSATPYASAAPFAENVDYPNQLENFEAAKFSNPTQIDNTWFPLKPGTQYTYEGFTEQEGVRTPHRFVLTVTDLTKTVMGVRSVVVWDQDFADGELAEAELALFAQADDGNIWHFGQYPEVYDKGQVVETPTWIAGIAGARPGITIKAQPQLGGPSYSQGWSPIVPWTDRARVGQIGVKDCVPNGCYENGIVTEEFSREEPNAFQLKYYAPGLGNTRVSFTGQDNTKETLELTSVVQLDEAALAEARTKVLELEKSGYERSRAVYALTTPIEQPAN